jgi:TPR repeat protein
VFEAWDLHTNRGVALKLLNPAEGEGFALRLERFRREGELANRIDHPGVVRSLDSGELAGSAYLVFELVESAQTLDVALRVARRSRRVQLVADLAHALGAAHAQGVVHRDVKPANVLVDAAGQVRVTDFGIGLDGDMERLTRTGELIGTPTHMAPEQAMGKRDRVGPATDVWAVGVILYEALTDRSPWADAHTVQALIRAVEYAQVTPPRRIVADLPPALEAACLKALSREPSERYPNCEALALALDAWRLEAAPRAAAELLPPARSRGAWVVAGGIALAGAAIGLGLANRPAPPQASAPTTTPSATPAPSAAPSAQASAPPVHSSEPELRSRAESGEVEAQARLARLLLRWGRKKEGRKWLEASAKHDSLMAVRLAAALAEDDPAQAPAYFEGAAERGELPAQVALGALLLDTDPQRGLRLLREAADKGDSQGMCQLGLAYLQGAGVEADPAQGEAWLLRAAEAGDFYGMFKLGDALWKGSRGLPADAKRGLRWLQAAARAGYVPAQAEYGDALESGAPGIPVQIQKAIRWLRQATELGSVAGAAYLGHIYRTGRAGIERDDLKARHLYESASARGSSSATCSLGILYREGRSVGRDAAKARRLFERATADGNMLASLLLARMLRRGQGGPKDAERAVQLLKELASDSGSACQELGQCYEFGRGTEVDLAQAADYYRQAAEKGNNDGKCSYGVMLENGRGVKIDRPQAMQLYREAAKAGHARAMVWLASMILESEGEARDLPLARRWLERAARRGDREGKRALAKHFSD